MMTENNSNRKVLFIVFQLLVLLVFAASARLLSFGFLQKPILNIMRFYDLFVLLLFAPVAVLLLWRLLFAVGGKDNAYAQYLFILGSFLIGAAFGMHEPMNILPRAGALSESVLASVAFFDDHLGHWIFFAGFSALSLSIILAEVQRGICISAVQFRLILFFACVTGIIIALNMFREKTALDIVVLLFIMAAAFLLRIKNLKVKWAHLPITTLLLVSGCLGTGIPVLYWLINGYPR